MNITIYPTCEHYNAATKKCTAYSDELCPHEGRLEVEIEIEKSRLNDTYKHTYTHYCYEIAGEKCCEGFVNINPGVFWED